MPGISPEELARIDSALKVSLDVLRHSAHVEASVLRLLEDMRRELIVKLAQKGLTSWGRSRLNQMLKDADIVISSYYIQALEVLTPTLTTVTGISAGQEVAALAATASMPSKAVLTSLVSDMLIEGSPVKAWWSKIARDTSFRFSGAVKQGIAQGETLAQIFNRVNEIVELVERNSTALVHTSIMRVMNDSTRAVLQENADITPTMRWLATLDSHTCIRCAPRDGLEWDTLTLTPVGHDVPFRSIPLHFGCRCKMVGVTSLMKRADKLGIGQRASSSGPVLRTTTFEEFLGRQSKDWQNDVLGKGRAELWRDKKLSLSDLINGRGNPLALEELEKKYGATH